MKAKGSAIKEADDFIMLIWISSRPAALFDVRFIMVSITSSLKVEYIKNVDELLNTQASNITQPKQQATQHRVQASSGHVYKVLYLQQSCIESFCQACIKQSTIYA